MVYRSLLYGDVPHRLFSPRPVIGILLRLSRLVGALLGVVFGAILWVGTCSAQEAPEAVAQPRQVATVSTSQVSQDTKQEKKDKVRAKYDVDCIGDRGIGHGVNMYSLSHERSVGESLAKIGRASCRERVWSEEDGVV